MCLLLISEMHSIHCSTELHSLKFTFLHFLIEGDISIRRGLTYETGKIYYLPVTATALALTSTATLTVTIVQGPKEVIIADPPAFNVSAMDKKKNDEVSSVVRAPYAAGTAFPPVIAITYLAMPGFICMLQVYRIEVLSYHGDPNHLRFYMAQSLVTSDNYYPKTPPFYVDENTGKGGYHLAFIYY